MDLAAIAVFHPRFEADRSLLVLELDHGKANEMGSDELDGLARLCELVENEPTIGCLCTTSRRFTKSGQPVFIAGANVNERLGWDDARVKAHVRRQRDLMLRVRCLPIFTIALTHGVTLGWGVEFLLTADYTLATASASFALPETGLGIVPGAGGTAELASLLGLPHAMRLGCAGETIAPAEALRIGLVQEAVDDLPAGLARVRELAGLLQRRSPTAIAAFKAAVLAGRGRDEPRRRELEAEAYELCVDSGDAEVGRHEFARIRSGERPTWRPRPRRDSATRR